MNLIGLDLDGTLEDSRRDMIAAVYRVRARFGLPPRAADTIAPWVNQGMETLYRNCFDDYLRSGETALRLAEVQHAYEADYSDNVAVETRLYPGVGEALTALSALGLLAVITNKPEKISLRLLEALKIDSLFKTVIGGDTCGVIKPNPRMLQSAAQRVGFNPAAGRAFMIGDTAGDIKMGRAFGATTIGAAWGYADSFDETPDFLALSPGELPGLVSSALAAARRLPSMLK